MCVCVALQTERANPLRLTVVLALGYCGYMIYLVVQLVLHKQCEHHTTTVCDGWDPQQGTLANCIACALPSSVTLAREMELTLDGCRVVEASAALLLRCCIAAAYRC